MSEAIVKGVAEAMRVTIQAFAETAAEQPHSMTGPKIGGPAMKQPTFNWDAEDKYSELKTFRLEVNNIWMGRLRVAAIECNYQEVDEQLKKQFIHHLNDTNMLEDIIKELMTVRGDDQITSGNVPELVKRVEAQRAQTAVMSAVTETKEFDKIKLSRLVWASNPRMPAQYNTPS